MTTLAELSVIIGLVGAEKVKSSLKDLKTDMKQVGDAATQAGQRIASGLESKLRSAVSAAGKFTVAMGAVGVALGGATVVSGVKASLAFTELQGRLEAVTGSAVIAARKLAFAQAVANPSNFSFSQLADATVTLEAFGINAERALPTVARLGMAFGADSEKLQMLTRALGDLSSGSFPEKDVLASFGLNRSMFATQGIEFDGSGQLLSSATKTFDALEKIVNTRYGKIFDKIGQTPGAKIASLADTWEKLLRKVGDAALKFVVPAVEKLTAVLSGILNGGVLTDVLDAITKGLGGLTGIIQGNGIVKLIAQVLSVLAQMPDAIKQVGKYIGDLFTTIAKKYRDYDESHQPFARRTTR